MKEKELLTRLLHPMTSGNEGWHGFEEFYGRVFPMSYKEVINSAGVLELFSFLFLINPFDKNGNFAGDGSVMSNFVNQVIDGYESELDYSLKGYAMYPEDGELFPIGGTENAGNILMVMKRDIEDHQILVADEHFGDFDVFDMNIKEFMISFIVGNIISKTFPREILERQGWPLRP